MYAALFFVSFPLLRCGWSCSLEAFPHKNKIKFLIYDHFVEKRAQKTTPQGSHRETHTFNLSRKDPLSRIPTAQRPPR